MSNGNTENKAVRIELSLAQARQAVITAMEANVVPMLLSSPGLGKSSMIKQVAKDVGLTFIDVRFAGMMPEDLNGFPVVVENEQGVKDKAMYVNFSDIFPTEDTPIPTGSNGWIVLLDELPSANEQVLAASYRLILDREVGNGKKLHPNCFLVAAGNKLTDNALVNSMGSALHSRICTLDIILNQKETLEYFIEAGYHPLVVAYLHAYKNQIHSFDAKKAKNTTFPCPRTWEMVSRIMFTYGANTDNIIMNGIAKALIQGCVGTTAAVEFAAFCVIHKDLPSFKEVIGNPQGCKIPDSLAQKYAMMVSIVSNLNDDNSATANKEVKAAVDYIMRIPNTEIRVVMFRLIKNMKPALYRNRDILELSRETVRN